MGSTWSVHAEGKAEGLREQVHSHEVSYWRHMPLATRLVVHHLVGHAVETAAESPDTEFILSGGGSDDGRTVSHTISLYPVPPQVRES